jgi:hypothetical protein
MSSPLSVVTPAHVVSKETASEVESKDKTSKGSSFEQALKNALSDSASSDQITAPSKPAEKGNVKEKAKAKVDELSSDRVSAVSFAEMPVWLSLQGGVGAIQAVTGAMQSGVQGEAIEGNSLLKSGIPSKKGEIPVFVPFSDISEPTTFLGGSSSSSDSFMTSLGAASLSDVLSGSQLFKQNIAERDLPEASSKVTLSGEWTPAMISGLASGADIEGTVGQAIKEVRSVLQEYWVPPVQVSTQSPTQAMVQLNLKNGEIMRLHIELGSAQTMNLRIEAPANVLADMQARLAPLQEALLQQGLSLSPIAWVAAKNNGTKAVLNAVGTAKTGLNGDRRGMNASDLWADDGVKIVASMEDVLE